MANLIINDNHIPIQQHQYHKMIHLFELVSKIFSSEDYHIKSVSLNNQLIEEVSLVNLLSDELKTDDSLRIEIGKSTKANQYDLALMISLINNISKCPIQDLCEEHFNHLLNNLQFFLKLSTKIKKDHLKDKTLSYKVEGLLLKQLSILRALNIAKKQDDMIMLHDLIEYELKANLAQWKIQIIPHILQIRNI